MTIKKTFTEIHALLSANPEKKVKEILPQATALMEAKSREGGTNCVRDAQNNVVIIVDAYDGRAKPIVGEGAVAFSKKASSSTGFNSYSNLTYKLWQERNNFYKVAHDLMMEAIVQGKVTIDEKNEKQVEAAKYLGLTQGQKTQAGPQSQELRDKVEGIKNEVKQTKEGFATLDEAIAAVKKQGLL